MAGVPTTVSVIASVAVDVNCLYILSFLVLVKVFLSLDLCERFSCLTSRYES